LETHILTKGGSGVRRRSDVSNFAATTHYLLKQNVLPHSLLWSSMKRSRLTMLETEPRCWRFLLRRFGQMLSRLIVGTCNSLALSPSFPNWSRSLMRRSKDFHHFGSFIKVCNS
ncbi:hypothetical protein PanWU01x14_022770, partial [Parasponia andersonii]